MKSQVCLPMLEQVGIIFPKEAKKQRRNNSAYIFDLIFSLNLTNLDWTCKKLRLCD